MVPTSYKKGGGDSSHIRAFRVDVDYSCLYATHDVLSMRILNELTTECAETEKVDRFVNSSGLGSDEDHQNLV